MAIEIKKFLNEDGVRYVLSQFDKYPDNKILKAVINAIDETKADKENVLIKQEQELTAEEIEQIHKNLNLDNLASEEQVESLYKSLTSNRALRFYCIEEVAIVLNGVSTTYPANSNVEVKFLETDEFEIIPTSNNSILALNAFPGALGTYYSWLEGVKQFSNILFDMNSEDMYSKWSQGNQGAYQVQYAQYINCIFWSDNAYVSDVAKRTNYTLYYTSQLPLCYSAIPDNTFKAFYLAFNVNSDPNWGNKVYRDSFAKATWATQVFSYYGARTIGVFGHDDPDFNIILPKDCRGLMYAATAIENAGTFDAINTTNFGAKSGSWREAFGECSSLRNLYIKNLKVSLNISWSPINYESIYFIISKAANTDNITISVSPYTYNLLGQSDFDLATSKNITIALLTTNYIEDKRFNEIANKADKNYVDTKIAELVNSAPDALDTLGELATAFNENKEVVDALNESIVNKQNKNVIVYRNSETGKASMTAPEIMEKVRAGENVYYTVSLSGGTLHPYLEGADTGVFFYSNYIDNDRVIGTGILVSADGTITTETYELEHLKDTVVHITSAERNRWNSVEIDNYYTKSEIEDLLNNNSSILVVSINPDTEELSHSFEEILSTLESGQMVFLSIYNGTVILSPVYISEDKSYISFSNLEIEVDEDQFAYAWINGCRIYNDGHNEIDFADLLTRRHPEIEHIDKDIIIALNYALNEKADKADILLKTEQTLTNDELDQVRKNLKFIGKDLEGQTFTIDGKTVTASPNAEIFGDYTSNIAVGQWSIAEGSGTVAKGRASHAEGAMTKAMVDGTHTEGYQTEATGYWSHAEGEMTKVTSYASHAEGSYCTMPDGTKRYSTAAGYASHTEGGGCYTSGSCAHAEGLASTASGNQSHAEGRYTIAAGGAQHVEGVANIEDTEAKYIHIAGNGTFENRSNAYTLDWSGNGWYAGTIKVGGTSYDDANEIALKTDLDNIKALPLTGGTLTGNLIVSKADASTTSIRAENSLHGVQLNVSEAGNAGLWDSTHSKWLIYDNPSGEVTVGGVQTTDILTPSRMYNNFKKQTVYFQSRTVSTEGDMLGLSDETGAIATTAAASGAIKLLEPGLYMITTRIIRNDGNASGVCSIDLQHRTASESTYSSINNLGNVPISAAYGTLTTSVCFKTTSANEVIRLRAIVDSGSVTFQGGDTSHSCVIIQKIA